MDLPRAWPDNDLFGPILFTNKHETVALVDIPAAIASAQGSSNGRVLLSSAPRTEPYPPNEPKTDKARENLRRLNCDATDLEDRYRGHIRQALLKIRQYHHSKWCLSRRVLEHREAHPSSTRHRLNAVAALKHLENEERENSLEPQHDTPARPDPVGELFRNLIHSGVTKKGTGDIAAMLAALQAGRQSRFTYHVEVDDGDGAQHDLPRKDNPETWDSCFTNPTDSNLRLMISDNSYPSPVEVTFYIPSRSTGLLGTIQTPLLFRSLVRDAFSGTATGHPTKVFNFICLDPPWPNSSVARKNNYNTIRYMDDLQRLLKGIDLDQYIAPGGYVGIWITNKPAMRKAVLDHNGLFDAWNVQLLEEWIYTKTTTGGEPITTLDGLWRKPYEIFLLGRAPLNPLQRVEPLFGATWNGTADICRRVVVAVPDFHSRKPCLKPLVERWLGLRDGEYEALELFARYAVAGWWSWGDECLRFNAEMYWEDGVAKHVDVDMDAG